MNSVIKSLKICDTPLVDDEYAILKNQNVGYLKGLEMVKQTKSECLIMSDQLIRREYGIPEGLRTVVASVVGKKAQFRTNNQIRLFDLECGKKSMQT